MKKYLSGDILLAKTLGVKSMCLNDLSFGVGFKHQVLSLMDKINIRNIIGKISQVVILYTYVCLYVPFTKVLFNAKKDFFTYNSIQFLIFSFATLFQYKCITTLSLSFTLYVTSITKNCMHVQDNTYIVQLQGKQCKRKTLKHTHLLQ